MAEWRSSAGSTPAFVGDDVVAVVAADRGANEVIDRIAKWKPSTSIAPLIDLILGGSPVESAPSFFAALRVDDQWRCAIRGRIELVVNGEEQVLGAIADTWYEVVVPTASALEVRVLAAAGDPWTTAARGATRVGGLRREGHATQSTIEDAARTLVGPPEDSMARPVEMVTPPSRYDDLYSEYTVAGGVEAAAVVESHADGLDTTGQGRGSVESTANDTASNFDYSAVAVSAIMCSQSHPNPPERERCWRCSSGLDSRAIVRVPRPSLGRLALEDGRELDIDRTVLLGRNPRAERTDAAHLPSLVSVGADAPGVSRTHARIFLDGWQVLVEDLGSTFGTNLVGADGATRRLRPGQPELVTGDAILDLGGGSSVRIIGVP